MDGINKYPVDFEAIEKGAVISAEEIEQITGTACGTDAYRLALLDLREDLDRQLESLGKHYTITTHGSRLNILTDQEAVKYTTKMFKLRTRGLARDHGKLVHVDRNNLDEATRRAHEHSLISQSRQLLASKSVRQQIKVELVKSRRSSITR